MVRIIAYLSALEYERDVVLGICFVIGEKVTVLPTMQIPKYADPYIKAARIIMEYAADNDLDIVSSTKVYRLLATALVSRVIVDRHNSIVKNCPRVVKLLARRGKRNLSTHMRTVCCDSELYFSSDLGSIPEIPCDGHYDF